MIKAFFEKRWYGKSGVLVGLLPFTWLYRAISRHLKHKDINSRLQDARLPLAVPVIIVGNVNVGGTGKTPVLISLVQSLHARGFSPGVISKGYGRESSQQLLVADQSDSSVVGDEPLLIHHAANCPVIVGTDRIQMVRQLASLGVDIVLSDDGLQDYKLPRNFELIVVDGMRWAGNGKMLPVGPLREPVARIKTANAIVINGNEHSNYLGFLSKYDIEFTQLNRVLETAEGIATAKEKIAHRGLIDGGLIVDVSQVQPVAFVNLVTGESLLPPDFVSKFAGIEMTAVAGLGNPEKFFYTLDTMGLVFTRCPFPDHHQFKETDFVTAEESRRSNSTVIVMTSKDAVKCRQFAQENWWELQITLPVSSSLIDHIIQTIKRKPVL